MELYKQIRDGATDPEKLDNIAEVEDDLLDESSSEASLMINEENDQHCAQCLCQSPSRKAAERVAREISYDQLLQLPPYKVTVMIRNAEERP